MWAPPAHADISGVWLGNFEGGCNCRDREPRENRLVNFVDSDPNKPLRRLFGYAIAAKRYALYQETKNDISVVKASGHRLGCLFAPKKNSSDEKSGDGTEADDEAPV